MSTMTPMITQSEAPACPPASLPKTAAEALAVVVVLMKVGLPVVVDVEGSSIGSLNGGFFVDGFGSASEIDIITCSSPQVKVSSAKYRVANLLVHLGWVTWISNVPLFDQL